MNLIHKQCVLMPCLGVAFMFERYNVSGGEENICLVFGKCQGVLLLQALSAMVDAVQVFIPHDNLV